MGKNGVPRLPSTGEAAIQCFPTQGQKGARRNFEQQTSKMEDVGKQMLERYRDCDDQAANNIGSREREERGIENCTELETLSCFRRHLFAVSRQCGGTLWGSWATGEAHALSMTSHGVFSLSDVDIAVPAGLSTGTRALICTEVLYGAHIYGLQFTKVSVRDQDEIMTLWDQSRIKPDMDNNSAARYLAFWVLMGAIEADQLEKYLAPRQIRRSYAAAKFFFKFCRNALALKGIQRRSYREIANTVYKVFPEPAIIRAYAVKKGGLVKFSASDIHTLLARDAWEVLLTRSIDTEWRLLMDFIRCDVKEWVLSHAALPTEKYLKLAARLVDTPSMEAAWKKAALECCNRDSHVQS